MSPKSELLNFQKLEKYVAKEASFNSGPTSAMSSANLGRQLGYSRLQVHVVRM